MTMCPSIPRIVIRFHDNPILSILMLFELHTVISQQQIKVTSSMGVGRAELWGSFQAASNSSRGWVWEWV